MTLCSEEEVGDAERAAEAADRLRRVFGLVSVWLRQYLHETPVFKEMQERQQLANELPLKTVVREALIGAVLTGDRGPEILTIPRPISGPVHALPAPAIPPAARVGPLSTFNSKL